MLRSIKELFSRQNSVRGASLILMVTLVCSNILGLFRDRFLAQKIPQPDLDTYFAAFRIPDLLFNLLILGAISSAFIPIFTSYLAKKEYKTAWYITNSVINIAILVLIIVPIILALLMPVIIPAIVPGFTADQKIQTINLARFLLATPVFFGISYILGGVLNSFKRFLVYSLTPLIYNLSIILATLLLGDLLGVWGVTIGVISGAFLHMAIQIPTSRRLGYSWRFVLDWVHPAVKSIGKLMLPRTIGLGASQIVLLVFTFLASSWSGNVTYFNFANNIQTFFSVVFGTSLAMAVFPTLSEQVSLGKRENFIQSFSATFRQVLFFIIPASILLILLRAEVVRLVLGTGYYGWEATRITANTLGAFAVGIWAASLIQLLARGFYAFQDTKTPMILGLISSLVTIVFAFALGKGWVVNSQVFPSFRVVGLAFSASLGSILNVILLLIILRRRVGYLNDKVLIMTTLKYLICGFVMAGVAQLSKNYLIGPFVNMQTFIGVAEKTVGTIILASLVYILLTYLWRCEELSAFLTIFKRKTQPITSNDRS